MMQSQNSPKEYKPSVWDKLGHPAFDDETLLELEGIDWWDLKAEEDPN
jgi:hypothetical protein